MIFLLRSIVVHNPWCGYTALKARTLFYSSLYTAIRLDPLLSMAALVLYRDLSKVRRIISAWQEALLRSIAEDKFNISFELAESNTNLYQ